MTASSEAHYRLFHNSYALMLNAVVNPAIGLLDWMTATHSLSAAEVGRGSALVSLMVLTSTLTQLNFSGALLRFLPRAGTATRQLVACSYGISAVLAALVATAVMAYCHLYCEPTDPLYVSLVPRSGLFSQPQCGPSSTCKIRR